MLGDAKSPKRRRCCRSFAVSHQERALALHGSAALFCYYRGGAERPNGFQVFLQSYESREGKGFKTWAWLWDIKDRTTTEYVLSLE